MTIFSQLICMITCSNWGKEASHLHATYHVKHIDSWDFPVVQWLTLRFHFRGRRFDPWSGN